MNENQEGIRRIADVLQIGSFLMNLEQSSNDDILQELEKQDNIYFKKILENQEKILEKLDKIVSGNY